MVWTFYDYKYKGKIEGLTFMNRNDEQLTQRFF
jgi:hypothetical protein